MHWVSKAAYCIQAFSTLESAHLSLYSDLLSRRKRAVDGRNQLIDVPVVHWQ